MLVEELRGWEGWSKEAEIKNAVDSHQYCLFVFMWALKGEKASKRTWGTYVERTMRWMWEQISVQPLPIGLGPSWSSAQRPFGWHPLSQVYICRQMDQHLSYGHTLLFPIERISKLSWVIHNVSRVLRAAMREFTFEYAFIRRELLDSSSLEVETNCRLRFIFVLGIQTTKTYSKIGDN